MDLFRSATDVDVIKRALFDLLQLFYPAEWREKKSRSAQIIPIRRQFLILTSDIVSVLL